MIDALSDRLNAGVSGGRAFSLCSGRLGVILSSCFLVFDESVTRASGSRRLA
jgi:hypothetical protein